MREKTSPFLERCRIKTGNLASREADGFNGAFFIPRRPIGTPIFKVICSNGAGWEHVSVSLPGRCPTWDEMCWVKDLFWEDEESVMQLHPPKSEYVNNVRYCLHLWRPIGVEIPRPGSALVGLIGAVVLPPWFKRADSPASRSP